MRVQRDAPEGVGPRVRVVYLTRERTRVGERVPRRKYGKMVKAIPPVKEEKCRYCRLGIPCPVHKKR